MLVNIGQIDDEIFLSRVQCFKFLQFKNAPKSMSKISPGGQNFIKI